MNTRMLLTLPLAAMMLCGCAPPDRGPIVTTITTEPPVRPTVAPPVPVAGDGSRFRKRVCDLLPVDQATGFGVSGSPHQTWTDDYGICDWAGDVRLIIAYSFEEDHFTSIYRQNLNWQEFEELTIDGQPAVRTSRSEPRISCHIVVGTAPNQTIDVSVSGRNEDTGIDWCGKAIEIAKKMLQNLKT